jgi:Flp pilus assembly protein TadD
VKRILIPLMIIAVLVGCSANRGLVKTEFAFANKLAKEGLWKEAYFRWNRSLAEGQKNVAVYNNMAIALEKMGKFDEAEATYKKALAIAPNNQTVKSNYNKLQKYLRGEDDADEKKLKGKKNEKRKKRHQ